MTILMVLSVDAGFAQKGNGIPGNVYAETTVYVTRTGKKYHAYACGNGTYYKSTLSAAKAKGKATIKAKVGGKTLACKIKVENPYISDKELTMRAGEEAFLEIKGCSHEPEWYCDDYDIVEVEDDGTIFASETGVTTVYATVHGRIFSCKVTVLPVTEDIEDPDVEIEY